MPEDGYVSSVKKLCEKYNVLLIADEVQTGLGHSGYRLAVDYDDCKPDIVVLGKVRMINIHSFLFSLMFDLGTLFSFSVLVSIIHPKALSGCVLTVSAVLFSN